MARLITVANKIMVIGSSSLMVALSRRSVQIIV
jgi:hypothetical protein